MERTIQPKISVVIPFKNAEKYLAESIESVINQKCNFSFEVIVVDDNSTDTSLNIAESFAGSVVLTHKSNGVGISDALNLGVQQSKSDLIARHDADDIMQQGRLQSQFDFMLANPDHVLLGGQISYIGKIGEFETPNYYPSTSDELESWLAKGCYLAHPTVVFRKDKFEEVGGYKRANDGAEDYDLWLRLSEVGKIANLEIVLTQYRKHNQQVTNKNWVRTHLRTLKVRLFWVFKIRKICSPNSKNMNAMHISRLQILKYLIIEIVYFSVTQIRSIVRK
jgi:glycosyltransferase involved in cell wall biosynthesis